MQPTPTGSYRHRASFSTTLSVGFFLATRQIRRSNIWTTILITFIMTLTFLNLVVVSGILVGLIEGATRAVGERYLGDIFISDLKNHPYIEHTNEVVHIARSLPGDEHISLRYLEGGTIESDYQHVRKSNELSRAVGTSFVGIDPIIENEATGLSKLVIKGQYLSSGDSDEVLLGALLLKEYLQFESPTFPVLENVTIGSKVRITVGGNTKEVRVKGLIKSKVDELDRRVFFTDTALRALINRFDYNADEIMITLKSGTDPQMVKQSLIAAGAGTYARVQTREDAEPKFLKDIKQTFAILGSIISSIGVVVACITIFIVIFVNAITRRKFIGILKGIGINAKSIEIAYIIQSLFYAILGSALGIVLVFGILKPYLDVHPINFPFSDGILVATPEGVAIRLLVLVIATVLAGYIPARIVVKQNTLDAILGR